MSDELVKIASEVSEESISDAVESPTELASAERSEKRESLRDRMLRSWRETPGEHVMLLRRVGVGLSQNFRRVLFFDLVVLKSRTLPQGATTLHQMDLERPTSANLAASQLNMLGLRKSSVARGIDCNFEVTVAVRPRVMRNGKTIMVVTLEAKEV